MPDPPPTFIDWQNSESKFILMEALKHGRISLDEEVQSAEELWEFYSQTAEFVAEQVPFQQFKLRLRDHRKVIKNKDDAVEWQTTALAHDRLLLPERLHNSKDEPKFYLTPAYSLLEQDVKEGRHKIIPPPGLGISRIQRLRLSREEYQAFPLPIFCQRVHQQIRRQKFIYYLELKREELRQNRNERRQGLGLPPL